MLFSKLAEQLLEAKPKSKTNEVEKDYRAKTDSEKVMHKEETAVKRGKNTLLKSGSLTDKESSIVERYTEADGKVKSVITTAQLAHETRKIEQRQKAENEANRVIFPNTAQSIMEVQRALDEKNTRTR